MKISELPECPEWLKKAETIGADVDWASGVGSWIVWRGGVWLGGEWRGGEWRGGEWRGGEWRGGSSVPRCKWRVMATAGSVRIGCKEMTVDQWDAWFAGSEEFETPRNSPEFKLIRANYEAVKAFKLWSEK